MLWYPELYYPDKGSPAAGAPLVLHQRQLAEMPENWYRDGKVPLQLKNIWTVIVGFLSCMMGLQRRYLVPVTVAPSFCGPDEDSGGGFTGDNHQEL